MDKSEKKDINKYLSFFLIVVSQKLLLIKQNNQTFNMDFFIIILDNIRQATEKIDTIWGSNEADIVKKNLRDLYSKYDDISESNKNLTNFLDKIVAGDYTALETDIDELINENISLD